MMRGAACALVILLVGLCARGARAQCVASGEVDVASATLGLETVERIGFRALDVEWPPNRDGTFVAHLHTPIEAAFPVRGVALTLVSSPFFNENVVLEFQNGRPIVQHRQFRVTGLQPGCEDVRVGYPGRDVQPRQPATVNHVEVRVGNGLVLHAAPDSPVRVRLTTVGERALLVATRRDGWTFVEEHGLRGWMRTDPSRERVRGDYGSGAGGFSGRSASVPRPPDLQTCYVGPALFRDRAVIRMAADDAATAWATITSPDSLIVRDCGDAYVEVIHLLGRWGHFGWVSTSDVARVGVLQCDDMLLVQNPGTRRIFVGTSTNDFFVEGDEITRVGDHPVVGPPFNTVTFWLLTDVCTAWRSGEPVAIRRGDETLRDVRRFLRRARRGIFDPCALFPSSP